MESRVDNPANNYQPGPDSSSDLTLERDPENRPAHNRREIREKMMDKTIADSFPTSDPPSTIPDPSEDDSIAA